MCVLTALVGINYMIICRLYPDGGGVYASVRHRSEVISIVGAFLLIADYLVTAAISALSAFQYLGVPHPEKFAAAAILAIGLLNLLGPKQTGGLAFLVSIPTVIVVIVLGLFCLPHISEAFGHLQPLHGTVGQNWFAFVGIVFGLLLLSASNTAIVDLIAIQFLMSRDRELPKIFQKLNNWGVPNAATLLATIVPMLLVVIVKDMSGLADLYAVGVVGAIATNLGATATDRKLSIQLWERTLMFGTFIVMAAIELSLLIDKPNARYFAVTILAVGLILRGLVLERRMKKEAKPALVPERLDVDLATSPRELATPTTGGEAILCAIRGTGRTLDFALREARKTGARLYLLFVREQAFMTEQDARRRWQDDEEASRVFNEAKAKAGDQPPLFAYAVSPSAAETIVDLAATLGASRLILGAPQRNALINLLRGNVIREVSHSLPEEIDLLVYA